MEMTLGSSFALHPHAPAHAAAADAAAVPPAPPGTAKPAHHFSFDDLLDIVNPLQHLPVVGTLYRKITGDKIGTPEKIVGDGIYGGVWGLVSSVADTLFEDATGKNFGDTVLAFASDHLGISLPTFADFKPSEPASEVATAAKPSPPASMAVAQAETPDVAALTASLSRHGFDHDTTRRALAAYRRMSMPGYAH
jgi:hypothetical protein